MKGQNGVESVTKMARNTESSGGSTEHYMSEVDFPIRSNISPSVCEVI